VYGANYTVTVTRLNYIDPILDSRMQGASVFKYNYNCAWLPLVDPTTGEIQDSLLVRCQNITGDDVYQTTPSKLAYTLLGGRADWGDVTFSPITDESIVFQPESAADTFGTEDPRIVYRDKDQTYYLLYSAVSSGPVVSRLALATTQTPLNASSWVRHGPLFPDLDWSKSGSLLIRDGYPGPHYLFWGDSGRVDGLTVATSYDLLNWTNLPGVWMPMRPDKFEQSLVEAGPMPLQLSDGNYLFIYNSARPGYPSAKPNWDIQYNVGWAVLDEQDPTQVIQRCEEPILSPVFGWETGVEPFLGLTPNVVFLQGWKPVSDQPDTFIAFYGAADSVVGVAQINVQIFGNDK